MAATAFKTVEDVVDALGGAAQVARTITTTKISLRTVASWKYRNFIPDKYRPGLIKLAAHQGIENVSYETLTHLCIRQPVPLPRIKNAE